MKSGGYWKEVRDVWAEIYDKNGTFSLKSEVDGKKLYQYHFGYAMQLEGSDQTYDTSKGRAHARETIAKFVKAKPAGKASKY